MKLKLCSVCNRLAMHILMSDKCALDHLYVCMNCDSGADDAHWYKRLVQDAK